MKNDMHTAQLNRLKRVEGQIRGITKMIEEGRYCIDVLTQFKAIRSALARVEANILETHLDNCVQRAVLSNNSKEKEAVISEIRDLLRSKSP